MSQDEDDYFQGPQRVWVLFGGEAAERQESLASGRAAWLALVGPGAAAAEAFLLEPPYSSGREAQRRRTLLRKRSELLLIGEEEEDLDPELQMDAIRCVSRAHTRDVSHQSRELLSAGCMYLATGGCSCCAREG